LKKLTRRGLESLILMNMKRCPSQLDIHEGKVSRLGGTTLLKTNILNTSEERKKAITTDKINKLLFINTP